DHCHVIAIVISVAVDALAPVFSCSQSPFESEVFCKVAPHEVVPLMLVDAVEREQAIAPADPLVSADDVKSTVVLPFGRKRCIVTEGVPASAVRAISTNVAVSGTWQIRVAVVISVLPKTTLQPPFNVLGVAA